MLEQGDGGDRAGVFQAQGKLDEFAIMLSIAGVD
jgi:hypothetical protein